MIGKIARAWVCAWFGCRPRYQSHCNAMPCARCGAPDTSYEDRIGDTRHARFLERLRYWVWRRWFPERCVDCGQRDGNHDACLPF